MRSFLSSIPIGPLLRPSHRILLPSPRGSQRVAWASTSAQTTSHTAEAFTSETEADTAAEASSIVAEGPEELRRKAIKLYKEVETSRFIDTEIATGVQALTSSPDPNYEFNKRLRRAFEKNSKTKDPEALQKQLELGEHIKKEVLALISLKKFRHLRRTYHANEGPR